MIKYYRFSYDYVLWGISYANLSMLLATIPGSEETEPKKEKVVVEDDLDSFIKQFKNE